MKRASLKYRQLNSSANLLRSKCSGAHDPFQHLGERPMWSWFCRGVADRLGHLAYDHEDHSVPGTIRSCTAHQ
jgi:hypothetical protein